jgi:hypothetical protein
LKLHSKWKYTKGSDGTTFLPNRVPYYTDGFKIDEMTGMGIYGPSVRYYEVLGESTTYH